MKTKSKKIKKIGEPSISERWINIEAYNALVDRHNNTMVKNNRLALDNTILVTGLLNLKKHFEIIGGALFQQSAAWVIITETLEKAGV